MPTRRLSMRKSKEVLRLRYELRLGQREIARACSISQSTVHAYLNRAAAAGVSWPLPEGWDESRLDAALFGEPRPSQGKAQRPLPDFPALAEQLKRHRHLTLQLTWEEYRQAHPEGYGYSRFCELYQRWRRKQDLLGLCADEMLTGRIGQTSRQQPHRTCGDGHQPSAGSTQGGCLSSPRRYPRTRWRLSSRGERSTHTVRGVEVRGLVSCQMC